MRHSIIQFHRARKPETEALPPQDAVPWMDCAGPHPQAPRWKSSPPRPGEPGKGCARLPQLRRGPRLRLIVSCPAQATGVQVNLQAILSLHVGHSSSSLRRRAIHGRRSRTSCRAPPGIRLRLTLKSVIISAAPPACRLLPRSQADQIGVPPESPAPLFRNRELQFVRPRIAQKLIEPET